MELRQRRSRPSYANPYADLGLSDDSNEVDPNSGRKRPPYESGSDSSDQYEPDVVASKSDDEDVGELAEEVVDEDGGPGHEDDAGEEEEYDDEDIMDLDGAQSKRKSAKSGRILMRAKEKHASPAEPQRVSLTRLAQNISIPNTATHQAKFSARLRPTSLFFPPDARRLTKRPSLFTPSEEIATVSGNNLAVRRRLGKAWSTASTHAPPWELLDDRGWYREGYVEGANPRRPIVHQKIQIDKKSFQQLTRDDAMEYLPLTTYESGTRQLPAALHCYLGPFDNQSKTAIPLYGSVKLGDHLPQSSSHVFNAGGPVFGLDWCPLPEVGFKGQPMKHYLAVGISSSLDTPFVGTRVSQPALACIQIWSLSPNSTANPIPEDDVGHMQCELVVCIETGRAWELKWCPLPSCDTQPVVERPRKLGLLAGAFLDGAVSVFTIPHPADLIQDKKNPGEPIYLKLLEPLATFKVDDAVCWCIDWANSDILGVGCTNGSIAVFRVSDALKSEGRPVLPTHYFPVHQAAIRSVTWIRAPPYDGSGAVRTDWDPCMISSVGYDGAAAVTDIREPFSAQFPRIRDFLTAMAFSPHSGGTVYVDQFFSVKQGTLGVISFGRGRNIMDAGGPLWDISTSDYHHNVAVASADGSVSLGTTGRHDNKASSANFILTLYQLDYNRKTGEYKMLDRFKPRELRETQSIHAKNLERKGHAMSPADPVSEPVGAWPLNVAVHRVAWHSGAGMARAPLLASGTASGLCRIDWLVGRFIKDQFPYQRIEVLRGEVEGAVDDDADDDD